MVKEDFLALVCGKLIVEQVDAEDNIFLYQDLPLATNTRLNIKKIKSKQKNLNLRIRSRGLSILLLLQKSHFEIFMMVCYMILL